jgi:hypothetical protein
MKSPASTSLEVTVDWDAPNDHSSTITQYDVQFLTATGTFVQMTDGCPGNTAGTLSTTSCDVTMSEILTRTGLSRD